MSLAPDERRTLARIEDSLSRSDPRLAIWLTTFTLPARLRLMVSCNRAVTRSTHLGRRCWSTRLAVLAASAALVSLMVACALALGNSRLPPCAGHSVVRTGTLGRVLTCQPRGSGVAGRLTRPGNGSRPGVAMT
ncbi:MAG TPA: hypothetical protein VGI74_07585, partial [Streptosporangiaceae bacterium]